MPTSSLRNVPLEHDLGVRGHLEVDRLAAHELDGLAAQEPGEHELVDVLRERCARRVRGHGIEPDGDRDRDPPVLGGEQVGSAVLVQLPVHERRAAVDHLHPVHADVAAAGLRILRDHGREGDERRGVARPAALDRQAAEIDVVALVEHLLARRFRDDLRPCVRDRLQLEQTSDLLAQTLRRLEVEDVADLRGGVVEPLDPERQAHAPLRAELVDEERVLRALRVLEQERRPARLHDPVDNLRDLEVGIGLGGDAPQLALALEEGDPGAEVTGRRRHGAFSLGRGRRGLGDLVAARAAAGVASCASASSRGRRGPPRRRTRDRRRASRARSPSPPPRPSSRSRARRWSAASIAATLDDEPGMRGERRVDRFVSGGGPGDLFEAARVAALAHRGRAPRRDRRARGRTRSPPTQRRRRSSPRRATARRARSARRGRRRRRRHPISATRTSPCAYR